MLINLLFFCLKVISNLFVEFADFFSFIGGIRVKGIHSIPMIFLILTARRRIARIQTKIPKLHSEVHSCLVLPASPRSECGLSPPPHQTNTARNKSQYLGYCWANGTMLISQRQGPRIKICQEQEQVLALAVLKLGSHNHVLLTSMNRTEAGIQKYITQSKKAINTCMIITHSKTA